MEASPKIDEVSKSLEKGQISTKRIQSIATGGESPGKVGGSPASTNHQCDLDKDQVPAEESKYRLPVRLLQGYSQTECGTSPLAAIEHGYGATAAPSCDHLSKSTSAHLSSA